MFIRYAGRGTLLTDVPELRTTDPRDQQHCVTSVKGGGPECVSVCVWYTNVPTFRLTFKYLNGN